MIPVVCSYLWRRPERRLCLALSGVAVFSATAFAQAEPTGEAGLLAEVAELRVENVALRRALADSSAALHRLEDQTAGLRGDVSSIAGAVALADRGKPARSGWVASPSSSLPWPDALRAASAARLMVTGASLLTVMPTGSMEPFFNERAILLLEPARYEDLKVGDVVTYKHPRHDLLVVHRLLEKRGDNFWAKGDNNGRPDNVSIDRGNYGARVFGIIYSREPSEQAQRFAQHVAAR